MPSSLIVSAPDKLKQRLRHCAAQLNIPVDDGAVSAGNEDQGPAHGGGGYGWGGRTTSKEDIRDG